MSYRMVNSSDGAKLMALGFVYLVFYLSVFGAVGYILFHFISKFW